MVQSWYSGAFEIDFVPFHLSLTLKLKLKLKLKIMGMIRLAVGSWLQSVVQDRYSGRPVVPSFKLASLRRKYPLFHDRATSARVKPAVRERKPPWTPNWSQCLPLRLLAGHCQLRYPFGNEAPTSRL